MENLNAKNLNIDEKLATLRFICDNKSHIKVDVEKCKKCKEKSCLIVCPANVYSAQEDGTINIDYENCLECGTCRICCTESIEWENPIGSKGVRYRFG